MWLTAQDGKYSLLCGSLGRELPHVSYTVNVTNSQSLPVALKIAWSIWQRILALQNMHITLSFSCAKWLKKLFNYYYSILVGRGPNSGDRYLTGKPTLIPSPPMHPWKRPGTHGLCTYQISHCILCKKPHAFNLSICILYNQEYRVFFKQTPAVN